MYYWEQCRLVAVLVDCVGLTSVQPFCLVVFCLSCSLSPCFPQAVRLSHFLQGQWHRMQSKPCISLRPWRYCIICPFFVFFVQMMGNGKAILSCVDCSHDNHRFKLSPFRFSFTHIHPPLSVPLFAPFPSSLFPLAFPPDDLKCTLVKPLTCPTAVFWAFNWNNTGPEIWGTWSKVSFWT